MPVKCAQLSFTAQANVSIYEQPRIELGINQRDAAERIPCGHRSLQNYEKEDPVPPPDVVLGMGRGYKAPELPLQHCNKNCPIGRVYHDEVQRLSIAHSVVRLTKEMEDISEKKVLRKLHEIAYDGVITDDEIEEAIGALQELRELKREINNLMVCAMRRIPEEKLLGQKEKPSAATESR